MIRKPLLLVSLIWALSLAAIAQQPYNFKNLAGTAGEMNEMRLPDVQTLGVKSKAAMLPIRFKDGKATFDIPVETSDDLRLSLLAPNSDEWKIVVSNGANKKYKSSQ